MGYSGAQQLQQKYGRKNKGVALAYKAKLQQEAYLRQAKVNVDGYTNALGVFTAPENTLSAEFMISASQR